jgi:hypothetical protein
MPLPASLEELRSDPTVVWAEEMGGQILYFRSHSGMKHFFAIDRSTGALLAQHTNLALDDSALSGYAHDYTQGKK